MCLPFVFDKSVQQRHKVLCYMVSPDNQVISLLSIFGYLCLVSNCSHLSESGNSVILVFPKVWFIDYIGTASSQ